jgi:hypothetical protein
VGYLNNTHPVSSNHNHSQIAPAGRGWLPIRSQTCLHHSGPP